jgi:2,4-dienoyl-CoA reductase-like NADH-dependent reductase (Old Yellow Enzyme family)
MLGSPLLLPNGTRLSNRIAKAAMEEDLAVRGVPGRELVRLYERWAQGGPGLLITGNVMIDRRAPTGPGAVVLEDDTHLTAFRTWAEAAKSSGSTVLMQLNHPGRQVPSYLARTPVAPSAIGVRIPGGRGLFNTPRALEDAEIEEQLRRLTRTAELAVAAGFDGVQLHAAHGYLISQFLSPLTNTRTDRWGGSLEQRARLLFAAIEQVRSAIGPDSVLSVKLNSADFQRGGFGENEARRILAELPRYGIDLLELSGGTYEAPAMLEHRRYRSASARTGAREAYFLEFAQEVRSLVPMPVMLTGGFRTRAAMAAALESRAVDVIGMAKPFCADPALLQGLLSGGTERIDWPVRHLPGQMLDSLATMGWARAQMHRLANGREPKPGLGPLRVLLRDCVHTQLAAWRYRRWLAEHAAPAAATP